MMTQRKNRSGFAERMTPRERMMTAMRNQQPDRVPVYSGASDMVPIRRTGRPFWDVYVNGTPSLWRASLDTAKYFGSEEWLFRGALGFQSKSEVRSETVVDRSGTDRWEVRVTHHTPAGDLTERLAYPRDNPPCHIERMVKNFQSDYKKLKYFYPEITGYDDAVYREQKAALGERGVMTITIGMPGLHAWQNYFEGNLEALTYAFYDYPDLFEELRLLDERTSLRRLELALEVQPDAILIGASGSLTLQSPTLWRQLSLPTVQKVTRMCKQAGVLSGLHSCGKERYVIEVCAQETDLNYIHPLEPPPMGDCDLGEVKRLFGHKLALMGNLQTTDVMLRGTPDDVRRESLKAILAAGINGGYVLTSGDQVGRDTPDANIFAMVETAKEFGVYPLDSPRIKAEIARIVSKTEVNSCANLKKQAH
jgi:uroporphyrinogen decarboxylase